MKYFEQKWKLLLYFVAFHIENYMQSESYIKREKFSLLIAKSFFFKIKIPRSSMTLSADVIES